jgi:EAL domain-containing protein (putative c-di-GMP-specific phosphodiesterase class I)
MRLLVEFGYELGQGYHLSRPLTPEQLSTLLADTGGLIRVRSFAQTQ